MAEKRRASYYKRRDFLKKVATGGALATSGGLLRGAEETPPAMANADVTPSAAGKARSRIAYPRVFSGSSLRMIAFPLGGLGTGTVSLGGRGQLRDWEIFNRPDKGNAPDYCFASIWAQAKGRKAVTRVLEARIETPYEGESGLGARNVPGLPRLAKATFTGAYPFARIEFQDAKLPVQVRLEAFNPLVPLDTEASGWPMIVLRYVVRNAGPAPARVGIAYSLQNMVGKEGRQAVYREGEGVSGLVMSNPMLADTDPLAGTMVLGALGAPAGSVSYLRGWKRAQWWDGPLTFWDDFSADGALRNDAPALSPVGSIAVTQDIAAGAEASVTFLLAWHFPNRTPERCGWRAVEGQEKTVVGNHYCQRFKDAWDVATQAARELPTLEARTRKFAQVVETSSLPAPVLDAALSNLSTLRTNTAFRTADGEFHGFEGCNDQRGCCHGSCTHVWNYEQATAFMFPTMSRSIRESEFLRNTNDVGLMGFRSYLPDGVTIWENAATDGQMGCLMKLYRDWQLSGDTDWLRRLWPQARKALEFSWIKGGWDADRDGVMEGVQHNTYDVEFYGPNPFSGIWYLGALRAGEEMARAAGDATAAQEYRRLFESGKQWIDANLFNGEYYIQKVVGQKAEEVAAGLRVGMGGADPMKPDYQMGEACLADQLLGQYMAHVVDLGYLLDSQNVQKTLRSIYRHNFRSDLLDHEAVQRIYAVNDDGGVLIATYPSGKRPEIPFPYFAEVWTGIEYQLAAHLIYEGMLNEGLNVVETVRRRHDGERRNPWNEPECGHHYARAMASWAVLLALNGFQYSGPEKRLVLTPRMRGSSVRSFWTLPSGWGSFSHSVTAASQRAEIQAVEGTLTLATLALAGKGPARATVKLGGESVASTVRAEANRVVVAFEREVAVKPDSPLSVALRA
jgi:non-lysosomal glucosylceramidase